jgi:hypothetical protein
LISSPFARYSIELLKEAVSAPLFLFHISSEIVGKDMLKDLPRRPGVENPGRATIYENPFGLYAFCKDSFFFPPFYMHLSVFFAYYRTQAKP